MDFIRDIIHRFKKDEDGTMSQKDHGTCIAPVQDNLLFGSDFDTADRICCYNRRYAEHSGYAFNSGKTLLQEM